MDDVVRSKNGVLIRLTSERWEHIVGGHNELAGLREEILEAIMLPQRVLAGGTGELLAIREAEPGKFLVAVYREAEPDGFVITAFVTRRLGYLDRRTQLWP